MPESFMNGDDVPALKIAGDDKSDDERTLRKKTRKAAVFAGTIRERRVAADGGSAAREEAPASRP